MRQVAKENTNVTGDRTASGQCRRHTNRRGAALASYGLVLMSAILVSSLFTQAGFAAGDAAAGQAKSAVCAACHGATGNSMNPEWPNLAGQKDVYLMAQMKSFRDGTRKNALMSPMAAALSDEDIENLAAYFSSQTCE